MRLWLTMGVRRGVRQPLRPSLRALDPTSGAVQELPLPRWDHPSPHGDHAELTGSRLWGDTLIACTRTGVLWIRRDDLTLVDSLTHPLLHDVHDAVPLPGGGVAVASTGIDSVLTFHGGRLTAHHWLQADGKNIPIPARN